MELFTHRFVLRGLNLERFINLTRQKDIPLVRLVRQDERSLACECRSSDLPAVIALSQEKGWRVENVRPARLSAFGQAMKKRPGVPAGIVPTTELILPRLRENMFAPPVQALWLRSTRMCFTVPLWLWIMAVDW